MQPNKFFKQCYSIFQKASCIFGSLFFLYLFSPIRFWGRLVIYSQIEVIKVSFLFACIILIFAFLAQMLNPNKLFKITLIDSIFIIYSLYLFVIIIVKPDKLLYETQFKLLIILLFYIYFRIVSHKCYQYYFSVLLIAGIIQIGYGIWFQADCFQTQEKGLSDIYGNFINTGPWGGFVAILIIISLINVFYLAKSPQLKYKFCFLACFILFIPISFRK